MKRIEGSTVSPNLHGSGKAGFREFSTGAFPTIVSADFLNGVQEEIANVIEGAGLTLDGGNLAQLWAALKPLAAQYTMVTGAGLINVSGTVNDATAADLTTVFEDTGFSNTGTTITFPSAGLYLVNLSAVLTDSDVANPLEVEVGLYYGDTAAGASNVMTFFTGQRWSGTIGDTVTVHGHTLVNVTNPGTNKLRVGSRNVGTFISTVNSGRLSIVRLRRG